MPYRVRRRFSPASIGFISLFVLAFAVVGQSRTTPEILAEAEALRATYPGFVPVLYDCADSDKPESEDL